MIYFWLIAFLLFTAAEAATINLVTLWFALGSIAALIAAAYSLSVTVQVAVFFVVSIIGLILFFLLIKPRLSKNKRQFTPTNADRIIGKHAVVSEKIDKNAGLGRIIVEGQDWRAVSEDESVIAEGDQVEVLSLSGAKAIVKKLEAEKALDSSASQA